MYRQMDILIPEDIKKNVFPARNPTGKDLRKVLARLNTSHQIGLPSQFFGYDTNGRPDFAARPHFTMGANASGSLRVTAIGPLACETLLDKSGSIQAAFIREFESRIQASLRSGPHAISSTGGNGHIPIQYRIHRTVVGKTTHDSWWWRSAKRVEAGGVWSERDHGKLADLIANGIFEQAAELLQAGDEIEGDLGEWVEAIQRNKEPKMAKMLFKKRMGLKVTAIEGYTLYRASGPQGLRVMLKGIELSMNADLQGPWIVGRNRIEGFGIVRPSRRPVLDTDTLGTALEAP